MRRWALSLLAVFSSTTFAQNTPLDVFDQKELQITILKRPPSGAFPVSQFLGIGKAITDEMVIVRERGEIVNAYVTSTAKAGKVTPNGVYSGLGGAPDINHQSSIYGSEMDYFLPIGTTPDGAAFGMHSTTENHYPELGREASMGCIRLERRDAANLFQKVTGITPLSSSIGAESYYQRNQIGFRIVSPEQSLDVWKSLSVSERKFVADEIKKDHRLIESVIKYTRRYGDRPGDPLEGEDNEPGQQAKHFPPGTSIDPNSQ